MTETLQAALRADIHKAMGASGLVPVKRMVRGKYGTYFAIRWIRPGEEQKGDIKIKNPTPNQYKQADAEATPEKASKIIDSISGKDPREMREGIAKMLQDLGGGHDAHHAVLEAMEAKGIKFENTGNILTSWENAIDPLMKYLEGRAAAKTPEATAPKPEPTPEKQSEPKQEEPAPEQKQELKGSEKQVKWATEIRDRMLDTFGKYRDYAKDKNPNEVDVVDSLIDAINKATNARTFIDLFQGFRSKGDLEQDVKSLYGYYGTAAKNASTDDEKRLVQPLLDVWAKFSNEKKEAAPVSEKKPEPSQNGKQRINDIQFDVNDFRYHMRGGIGIEEGDKDINEKFLPSKEEILAAVANEIKRAPQYKNQFTGKPVDLNDPSIFVGDISVMFECRSYIRKGYTPATVSFKITDGQEGKEHRVLSSAYIILPPTGKDKDTVTIRGQKYARRLFEHNCGRNDLMRPLTDETEVDVMDKTDEKDRVRPMNWDRLPITMNRDQYMKIPRHIRGQLTFQSVVAPVATAIATGQGVIETPELNEPHVIYNLELVGGDKRGNLTIKASVRGEDGFDKRGQYTIQLTPKDLHIDSEEEYARTRQAQRLKDLESDIDSALATENSSYFQISQWESEISKITAKEYELGQEPQKHGAELKELYSKRKELESNIQHEKWNMDNRRYDLEAMKAEYEELCQLMDKNAKKFDEKPLKGQQEITENYVPPKPKAVKKPKKESKPAEEKPAEEKSAEEKKPPAKRGRKPKTKYEDSPYSAKDYWNSFDGIFPPILDMKASNGIFDENLARRIREDTEKLVELGKVPEDWRKAVDYYLNSWKEKFDGSNYDSGTVERYLSTNMDRPTAQSIGINPNNGYDRIAILLQQEGFRVSDEHQGNTGNGIHASGSITLDMQQAQVTPNALIRIHDDLMRQYGLRPARPAEIAAQNKWKEEMEAEIAQKKRERDEQEAKIKEQYFHGKTEESGIQLKARAVQIAERSIRANLHQGEVLNKLRLKRIEKVDSDPSDPRKRVKVVMIADVTNSKGKSFRYPIAHECYVDEGRGDEGIHSIVEMKYKPSMTTETSREILDRFDKSGAVIGYYRASGAEAKSAHLYDTMADTVNKIYPKLSDDDVHSFRGCMEQDWRTAEVLTDPQAAESESRNTRETWEDCVKTAQIIDQCSTKYDTCARDGMSFSDFARRVGLNEEQMRLMRSGGDLSFLRGVSYKSAGFTTAMGVSTDYPFKDVEIQYLIPSGSKVAYTQPFYSHIFKDDRDYHEGVNWKGNLSVPFHEVKQFNTSAAFARPPRYDHVLMQKNSNFRIIDATERKGSKPDNRKLQVTIVLEGSHTWDDDPHGAPPKDWNPKTTPKWW